MEGRVHTVGDSFRIKKIKYTLNLYILCTCAVMVHFLFVFFCLCLIGCFTGWLVHFDLALHNLYRYVHFVLTDHGENVSLAIFKRKIQTDQSCKRRSLENEKLGKLTCEGFYDGRGGGGISKIDINGIESKA